MFDKFRALVLWLMALAIPVQGLAVPAHLSCLRDVSAGAVATVAAPSGHEHRSAVDGAAPSPSTHAAAGHATHGSLECCSAGCSLLAVALAAQATRSQARSPAPADPVATLYRGVILDGLDRPPRARLA